MKDLMLYDITVVLLSKGKFSMKRNGSSILSAEKHFSAHISSKKKFQGNSVQQMLEILLCV